MSSLSTQKATANQSGTQTSFPSWAPQANALTSAFSNAGNAYNQASTAAAPTNFTAGMTPDQISTFHSMVDYGGNNALPAAQSATALPMFGAGSSGALGALSGLGSFDPNATNNSAALTQGANDYMKGVDIPGQVAAAMRDATQEAHDVTLPGMESSAASSGNINSSRTGLAEGVVQRGLAQKAGDLSATLSNQAYTTGADLTAQRLGLNNSQALQALMGAGGLGIDTLNAANSTGANSINNQGNLFDTALTGGAGLQSANQLGLTNALQQYQSQVSSPYDALQGLMGIIGTNNWGQTTNSSGSGTSTNTPSAFQTIGGLLTGTGSLLSGFRV